MAKDKTGTHSDQYQALKMGRPYSEKTKKNDLVKLTPDRNPTTKRERDQEIPEGGA